MNNRVDINNVLAEIRNIRSQMQQPVKIKPEVNPAEVRSVQPARETPNFNQMLTQAVNQVNDLQQNAAGLANAYQAGDPQADLTEVMIASQKSSIAFQALTQVRNKVVQAYEDIMKMPI
ncbi:flagellar hook-basal body complex protein FliE [Hahella sp. CCB-MM4]|uniref:flagellar hook-basal body complex protein FliE n=1 Tax=Hahella sp. (strain CCB-MM4) TaxID=1926491 RepID=UPI000B9B7083|nr:flagellar hook-basal body complex protein FliE [Hahella sp. CCB-MM4]OZG72891.1 flagellar hook-basal body complex protein FliE [Hahella sp. CCB-MM4]